MFRTFFFQEIKIALKAPMIYIFTALMALIVFGATASDNIVIGGAIGNIHKNAPHVITVFTVMMGLFGLLIAASFFNNAALRDYDNNFYEILYSTSLTKSGYFFGRFFGALFIATIPMLGVFIGVIFGTLLAPVMGWVSPERYGSLDFQVFINNYFIFILPNMFFAGTIIYALAHRSRTAVVSFVGAMVIIVGYIVARSLMSNMENENIAALVDSFGNKTYLLHAKYYTPIEKNTLIPSFSGMLLWNRLLWIAIGFIILVSSYFGFSFKPKQKKYKKTKIHEASPDNTFTLPSLNPVYDLNADWLQFKSFFYINFLSIVKSTSYKILFLFSAILLFTKLYGGFEYYGIQSYPLTYKMMEAINGNVFMFVIIILVFFSGELIWRDRESKIHEVVDATPHTSFISMVAKALSLTGVAVILHLFFILCGVIYQLINGYNNIELDVYIKGFIYSQLILYFVWSGVMILIQVLLNKKYIAYFVSILFVFVWGLIMMMVDVESNMVVIGSGPTIMYSDMNGFGPGLLGAHWFNLYWVLFTIFSLMVAGALWNRGVINSLKNRLLIAKKQVPKLYLRMIGIIGLAWVLVAGFVFYNTQVLNPYKTSKQMEKLSVEYEKKYKKYEHANLPKITNVNYNIDIFPNKRDVYVSAIVQLTNESDQPIDSLHWVVDEDWNTKFVIPNAKEVLNDQEFGYVIQELTKPILAGQSIEILINSKYITEGFENERGNTSIANNGTFINNFDIMPSLGYTRNIELRSKNKRKKYKLPPTERMPKLEANCSSKCMVNYLTDGKSDFINVETVIATSGDQIAIAPGSLIKEWKENGRNYYHYKIDYPSQNFYSFISARYEVAKRKWNDVDIEVYYDKKHGVNVEMMLDAVERSLDYYTKNYGPYMHKQCRILEFPRYSTFAQAFPGTMPYSESFGFVANLEDITKNNVVDAVIAHEMAHQWWAHQVLGATMQGATMFSEAFAEYSSLMTMKKLNSDPMKMRDFLKYSHDRYLRGRSSEISKELPLYKVENQQYIHYGKGSVIMYALQDYIGEDKVNSAMKSFLEEYKYRTPYPTSLDFLRYIEPQVPDSLKYIIDDWFKEITLYDNRVKTASYKKLTNGKYQVNIDVLAHKIRADSIGNETEIAINDYIDIGLFADKDEKKLMEIKRVKINKEEMHFTFEVDSIPAKVSIDPKYLLIDRVYKDNTKVVKEE